MTARKQPERTCCRLGAACDAALMGSAAGQSFVEFRDVDKSYDGRVLAVRDLNLSVFRGEFLTLLGPSGSGKTTTLNMLAGFERPTRGEHHRWTARRSTGCRRTSANIGMVFQNYALFPHMTVAENVAFPLAVRRMPARRDRTARCERALSMVRLARFGDAPAGAAFRRPAAARRAGARAGVRAEPGADGRAARRARPASCASTCRSS